MLLSIRMREYIGISPPGVKRDDYYPASKGGFTSRHHFHDFRTMVSGMRNEKCYCQWECGITLEFIGKERISNRLATIHIISRPWFQCYAINAKRCCQWESANAQGFLRVLAKRGVCDSAKNRIWPLTMIHMNSREWFQCQKISMRNGFDSSTVNNNIRMTQNFWMHLERKRTLILTEKNMLRFVLIQIILRYYYQSNQNQVVYIRKLFHKYFYNCLLVSLFSANLKNFDVILMLKKDSVCLR